MSYYYDKQYYGNLPTRYSEQQLFGDKRHPVHYIVAIVEGSLADAKKLANFISVNNNDVSIRVESQEGGIYNVCSSIYKQKDIILWLYENSTDVYNLCDRARMVTIPIHIAQEELSEYLKNNHNKKGVK